MKKLFAAIVALVLLIAPLVPVALAESDVIVIGAITDLTGSGSVLGTACNNGWDLAVKHINAAGGVNGKQLKLVSYDTKSNPQEALACYERLVSVDGASIVVGPPFSTSGLRWRTTWTR